MGRLYEKCKTLYRENYEIVKESMGKAGGGDGDGSFFVFDEPVMAHIDLQEAFTFSLRENEVVLGVFYSDNRICNADCIIVKREDGTYIHRFPFYSDDLHEKVMARLLAMKECGRLRGFRWNDDDGLKYEDVLNTAIEYTNYNKQ